MTEEQWDARLYPTSDRAMRIDAVHAPGDTPGNVGICFSGGGSRALAAAMGQLRGLCRLQANGRPLYAQARAVAAVSGGSWCLAPFTFLPDAVSDTDFLGAWCPPERLNSRPPRPGFADQSPRPGCVEDLPADCIGQVPANPAFALSRLSVESLELARRDAVRADLLWQTLMGRHVLQRYGLYRPDAAWTPTTTFTWDAASRDALCSANPGLDSATVLIAAQGADRVERPFLICGSAQVVEDGSARRPLAPVHITPVFTGVLATPPATDVNGRPVGGGGVTSLAFATRPLSPPEGERIQVAGARPWSLFDAVGTSSVSYAESVQNFYNELVDAPAKGRAAIIAALPGEPNLPEDAPTTLVETAAKLTDLNPRYPCWPVRDPRPADALEASYLADGGSLDNTAITYMLAYADIDHVIAFVNSMTPMADTAIGVVDADGVEVPDSRVMIYEQVPPLFGYQPWQEGVGYRLYARDAEPHKPVYQHNQVFEAAAFAPLLRALRAASQADGAWYDAPTVATVDLRVLANLWHGIRGRGGPGDADPTPIRLTLSYLARVRRWRERLTRPLQVRLGPIDRPESYGGFPNLSTMKTHFSARGVNLLAHQTAWCVADPSNAAVYTAAFGATAAGRPRSRID